MNYIDLNEPTPREKLEEMALHSSLHGSIARCLVEIHERMDSIEKRIDSHQPVINAHQLLS